MINMPRTKQRRTKQAHDSMEETEMFIKEFERQAQVRIMKLETEAKMSIKSLGTFIDLKISSLPAEIRQMTLRELLSENDERINEPQTEEETEDIETDNYNEVTSPTHDQTLCPPTVKKLPGKVKRATTTSDDGYDTEGTTNGTRASRASRASKATKNTLEPQSSRATRSNSKHNTSKLGEVTKTTKKFNKNSVIESSTESKFDKFKTPAPSKNLNEEFNLITPKIKPNTPLNVLRRPREGEMVVSMQGSPLLVSAIVSDKTANINVPLKNGNVMSLLPKDGLRMSHIPTLDEETINQLQTLKNHIEKVISLK